MPSQWTWSRLDDGGSPGHAVRILGSTVHTASVVLEAMMDRIGLFSVHDVIEHLDQMHGKSARVAGVLQLEFECDALWHMPKSERVDSLPYRSGLWVHLDDECQRLGPDGLHRFKGRLVIVTGVIDAQDSGHMGLWPAAILVSSITKS